MQVVPLIAVSLRSYRAELTQLSTGTPNTGTRTAITTMERIQVALQFQAVRLAIIPLSLIWELGLSQAITISTFELMGLINGTLAGTQIALLTCKATRR
jgi:hypothetical protein